MAISRAALVATLSMLTALTFDSSTVIAQQSATYPNIEGTWAGSYRISFPHEHPRFPDGSIGVDHEIEVYAQDENLVWFETRWRWDVGDEWVREFGTGTFRAEAPTELILVEAGPPPAANAQSGLLFGEVRDGLLYLTYAGFAAGVAWSAALERKAE